MGPWSSPAASPRPVPRVSSQHLRHERQDVPEPAHVTSRRLEVFTNLDNVHKKEKNLSVMPMTLNVSIKMGVRITKSMQGLSVRDCGEASCLAVPPAPYRARCGISLYCFVFFRVTFIVYYYFR